MHSQLNALLGCPSLGQPPCNKLATSHAILRLRPGHSWLEANHLRKKLDVSRQGVYYAYVPPSYQENAHVDHKELSSSFEGEPSNVQVVSILDDIEGEVVYIKRLLSTMEDGRISSSAYDTAWVALVEDIHGSGTPQFPTSLKWISDNQLDDGSWGDPHLFSAYDRLINTLACVIALKSWEVHHDQFKKGMSFIKENIGKLDVEDSENMTIGFEVAFPSLIERAKNMGIEIPHDSPALKEIFAMRDLKLAKIPMEILHSKHTTLLFSLEGLKGLDWERLLKLKSPDGSFLTSPSSTAFALINTNNLKCFNYLKKVVEKFNGGVPHTYPVDTFAWNWAVDRLQRLGISRFFQSEIKNCMNYIYRCWSERGLFSGRDSPLSDIDDTAMAFRLLRLHGHEVSSDVFLNFKSGDKFQCFPMQCSESITAMFSLYRASQIRFPGEKTLEEANVFSYNLLRERQANDQLRDKWVIAKDLPGEIGNALDIPWYANLPRVEARFYIEQYGGKDDVWIGKSLYRMPEVSNDVYLKLAKLDFNNCQAQHLLEWNNMYNWYTHCKIDDFGLSRENVLFAYFLAAANIFEPERSVERIAWAKSAILMEMVASYYRSRQLTSCQQTKAISIREFQNNIPSIMSHTQGYKMEERLEAILVETLHQISVDTFEVQTIEIYPRLCQAWEMWLTRCNNEVTGHNAELLVRILTLSSGCLFTDTELLHPQYKRLSELNNEIWNQLSEYRNNKVHGINNGKITSAQIESNMEELVQLVFQNSFDGTSHHIKQTFLTVAKSYYYSTYFAPETIRMHIAKVLFEEIV